MKSLWYWEKHDVVNYLRRNYLESEVEFTTETLIKKIQKGSFYYGYTERKLSENQKKLEFISEHTSDGIMTVEKGHITYVSPAFSKLSGYKLDFVNKLTVDELFNYIHPEDVGAVRKIVYENLEQKNTQFRYEYRFLGTDGNYYWREDYINVIYKQNSDDYSKYIINSRDIDQRKKIEEQLLLYRKVPLDLIFKNINETNNLKLYLSDKGKNSILMIFFLKKNYFIDFLKYFIFSISLVLVIFFLKFKFHGNNSYFICLFIIAMMLGLIIENSEKSSYNMVRKCL